MFQHVNPIGISISQAKKDAKKHSKQQKIPLSQAQDEIASKHSRSTWAQAMKQMKQPIKISFKKSLLTKHEITFPEGASFSFVLGQSGTGKSVLLYEIMKQLLAHKIPVTYLSMGVSLKMPNYPGDLGGKRLYELSKNNPELLQVFGTEINKQKIDINSISLRGGVLMIDESYYVFHGQTDEDIQDLLSCSKHTLITGQSFRDIENFVPEHIQEDNLQLFMFKMMTQDIERVCEHSKATFTYSDIKRLTEELKPDSQKESSFVFGNIHSEPKIITLKGTDAFK